MTRWGRMPRSRRVRLVIVVIAVLASLVIRYWPELTGQAGAHDDGTALVAAAFEQRRSGFFVEVEGKVERLLRDDLDGSRHQKFLVRLASGQTLLISHNIDLAPRVPAQPGAAIRIRGEYEWNKRGGLLHWTHHDPQGRMAGGWIRLAGETYD